MIFAVIVNIFFVSCIISAVIAYFYKRKKNLERMALKDKIDDMFGDYYE